MARYFTRDEARALAEKALSFSSADEARVNISSGEEGNTRFAVNQVSTAGDIYDSSLVVTSAFGKKVASARTNRFDDESIRRVVETSEELARLVPENPEYMGELGPQDYAQVDGLAQATADLTPEQRAAMVTRVTEPAAARDLLSTGFLVHNAGSQAVATSKGLFAYATSSRSNFTTTVRTPDGTGSGWAGGGSYDISRLDVDSMAERAIEKAEMSRNPRAVEPGRWTVILEPTAVANMVSLMMRSMSARSADEGRSFFSKQGGGNRIGEQVVDERVTIYSDPGHPDLRGNPFSGEGLPNRRMVWIEDGSVRNLVYNRFWADRQGVQPTGFPSGFYMEGGDSTVEDMIRSTERGLLVTRFWYIRGVDPRTILYTGLTRDGTFLVENGRISHAVKNLRWNESPVFLLNNIEMMGRPMPASASESGSAGSTVMVPAIKARDFTFTSLSDAV
ncbi:MAG TPA: TldD/PmbA family protein [Longimicrobiales bacterium]|nr:TldD/PmbA family protein [Longimicrobiales bacterium]